MLTASTEQWTTQVSYINYDLNIFKYLKYLDFKLKMGVIFKPSLDIYVALSTADMADKR